MPSKSTKIINPEDKTVEKTVVKKSRKVNKLVEPTDNNVVVDSTDNNTEDKVEVKKSKKVVKSRKSKKDDKVETDNVETDKVETDKVETDKVETDKGKKSKKTKDNSEKVVKVKKESKVVKTKKSTVQSDNKTLSKDNVKSDSESEKEKKDDLNKTIQNNMHVSNDNDVNTNLELLLNEKKKEWANITAQINILNQDRDRLELEQKNLVKELTELMSKLQTDEVTNGFILEQTNKISVPKEIISTDVNSVSSDSDSDSDSELDSKNSKPKLNCKKYKSKPSQLVGISKETKTSQVAGRKSKKLKKIVDVESSDSDSDSD
jgi:hypothetical protein